MNEREIGSHHDDFVATEAELRALPAYARWVEVVRKERNTPDWEPSVIDLTKSRLFWWIRSGHEPLPYPPPTAYSCPWYELVVEADRNHSSLEFHIAKEGAFGGVFDGQVLIAQCPYKIIEKRSETEYIVGFGPYRFLAFRDPEMRIEELKQINPHIKDPDYDWGTSISDPAHCWWLRRQIELEAPE